MTTSVASTELSARSKARKRALDILYQSDVRGDDLAMTLAVEAKRAASEPAREASWLYAREIVDGVIDNRDDIDEQIITHARDWKIDRMPAVAIDEAVELAKEVSTDDSGSFIHGVLARITRAN